MNTPSILTSSLVENEKEFHFTDDDFEMIRNVLYSHTGISLNDGKIDLVYGRLSRRLRILGLSSFSDYLQLIDSSNEEEEIAHFINALTTNLTAFFREPHHFEYLANVVLPEIMQNHSKDRRIRFWSAGCSTGEEPYSIAMTTREVMNSSIQKWDIKILATDIDSNVVAFAKKGEYTTQRIAGISEQQRKDWFHVSEVCSESVKIKESLQKLVTFKQLNLMDTWPMRGLFDLIFCRNVVIYFDKSIQRKLFDRYADSLVTGGYLFIGHSENLHNLSDRFELIGQTIYRKIH